MATRRRSKAAGAPRGLTELSRLAEAARTHAHAPFSGFAVGAALRTTDGQIVTGCNVENATYGLTLCAERVAVFKAVSEGLTHFDAIAVVAGKERPASPCGSCRQILWEFCGDIVVHMAALNGDTKIMRMSELLPNAFDAGNLS